ncbi:MAG: alanine racemase [Spirochaetaceae bacterium]
MRASRAIIRLDHLRSNIRAIKAHLAAGAPTPPIICCSVKAQAYGHGMLPVARTALEEGVAALAVATVEEGRDLRTAEPEAEIIMYGHPVVSEVPEIVASEISTFVSEAEVVRALDAEARNRGIHLRVHLIIDTGMGRVGCRPEDALSRARLIDSSENLVLRGIVTHFPAADGVSPDFTRKQVRHYNRAVAEIREAGIAFDLLHTANSGATLAHPESWFDMVRPGILLYGYYPSDQQERILPLKPVMSLESNLSFVKRVPENTPISYGMSYRTPGETVIGTVPLGYADGYLRLFSNKSDVLVYEGPGQPPGEGGRRVPVVGVVCMDQFMVDLGPGSPAVPGDRVVVFGPEEGAPTAESLATLVGTIPYEILTRISPRVPRIYVDEAPGE